MGGFGSGRHRAWRKRTVESCHAIDTAKLRRSGLLAAGTDRVGTLSWGRGGARSEVGYALTVGPAEGTLRLMYTVGADARKYDYPVRLVTTGCHFGGVRWWFRCPLAGGRAGCHRRVRTLHLAGRCFGCRDCDRLTYTTTRESDRRVYALLRCGLPDTDDLAGRTVGELGLLLKALTVSGRRLDRLLGDVTD